MFNDTLDTRHDSLEIICGLCQWKTPSLQVLHIHLMNHIEGGNYTYHHAEKTAFPVRNLVCSSTQTEAIHVTDTASQTDESTLLDKSEHSEDNASYPTVKIEFDSDDIRYKDNKRLFPFYENECSVGKNEPIPIDSQTELGIFKTHKFSNKARQQTNVRTHNQVSIEENYNTYLADIESDSNNFEDNGVNEGHGTDTFLQGPQYSLGSNKAEVKDEPEELLKRSECKVKVKRKRKCSGTKAKRQKECDQVQQESFDNDTDDYFEDSKDSLVQSLKLSNLPQKKKQQNEDNTKVNIRGKAKNGKRQKPDQIKKARRRGRPAKASLYKVERSGPRYQLHSCHLCPRQFTLRNHICRHIESDHAGQYQWKCDTCRVPFVTEEEYSFHVKHCTNSWCKSHSCSHCCHQNLFLSRKLLLAHLRDCHDDIFPMNCNICNVPLASEFDEREHMVEHDNELLKCQFCSMVSKSVIESEIHMMSHVKGKSKTPFICYICDKDFARLPGLQDHVYTHLDDEGSYMCDKCGASFASAHRRLTHSLICQKRFKCDKCDRAFTHNNQLQDHLAFLHDGPKQTVICDQCGSSFPHKRALFLHERAVHSKDTNARITCRICQKEFHRKTSHDRHILIHENILPFQCQYCEKKFRSKWNHDAHVRQHTGVKPYVCTKCGLAFTHNVVRKTHEAKCNS